MVDFNVLIGKTLATRLSIDLEMIGILHILRRSAVVLPARVQPTQLLLRLLLVEDVQVGAVWGLDRDDQALVVRNPVLRVPCTAIVPNGQVFEVFIGDISIVSVLRVRKNLLLLFFEICYQIVQLGFCLTQLFLVVKHLKIPISQLWIHVFQRVCEWVTTT